jgi:hypothetical protein
MVHLRKVRIAQPVEPVEPDKLKPLTGWAEVVLDTRAPVGNRLNFQLKKSAAASSFLNPSDMRS